jgi:hypothetical protein
MTIEFGGHVKSVEFPGGHKVGELTVTLQLEAQRANAQTVEIAMSREEAAMYLPGTAITLRFWPHSVANPEAKREGT